MLAGGTGGAASLLYGVLVVPDCTLRARGRPCGGAKLALFACAALCGIAAEVASTPEAARGACNAGRSACAWLVFPCGTEQAVITGAGLA
ncbi:MAG: hypothetical protein CMK50_00110 [Propionibacteriaceae bacterium]|nr:hypothetical protein [Propionibacteriaceae bacterium]